MNKIEKINFKKIKRISPSQFYSMKNCAYKTILAEAFDKNPILPPSPTAYFGTVIHKILELISKGNISNDEEFNVEFDKQIQILEDELLHLGFGFFVPLKINVRNFGLKKIQLKKHLRSDLVKKPISSGMKIHSERWIESQDKLIGGQIDLIIENGNNIEIVDFKTGSITQDFWDDEGELYQDIKNEYKEQLKLYAYLYFENTNNFPTILSLVDLTKQKFSLDFSEKECKNLFEEAKNLLKSTNESIDNNLFSANPNQENCKYCLYRPACSFFHKKLETEFSFNDVMGQIKEVKKFQNGKVSIYLDCSNTKISINNFDSLQFDELINFKNRQIKIYNLRKETSEFVYTTTNTTVIYE